MEKKQTILQAKGDFHELDRYLADCGTHHILLVHGASAKSLAIGRYFASLPERMGVQVVSFREFEPNPRYESVVKGIWAFRAHHCDMVSAIGGGSAMDVAKCIKLYAEADTAEDFLHRPMTPNGIPLLAVPTTAGTGSESTRYAVVYLEGEKQSVTSEECIPDAVLFDASVLETLPLRQRRATFLDALCHAIESYWSVNSTEESRRHSGEALRMMSEHRAGYLANDPKGNDGMLQAANLAGRAIDITQTTAGHAMCYKLTSRYGLPHGQAAALCVASLWPYMERHIGDCIDRRGPAYLQGIFRSIARDMGHGSARDASQALLRLLREWDMLLPDSIPEEEIEELAGSVHPTRLRNHPLRLDEEALRRLYRNIGNMRKEPGEIAT